MPPQRGRPRTQPQDLPAPEDPAPNAYTALYPPDKTQVGCELCKELVSSIAAHLLRVHPTVRLEEYREMFPSAPIEGEVDETKERTRAVRVTQAEAVSHPGGREAAIVEKTLDFRERAAYRADVVALLSQGHDASHQLASVAYLMTLSRRTRLRIEQARDLTGGEVFHSEALDRWHDLEAKIGRGVADLEKIRAQRISEAAEDQPLAVITQHLEGAEAWVQAHIGEHMGRCPDCGRPLMIPELPHWAYQPLQTEQGLLWPVWSPEMWTLVRSGELTLANMAYLLRTSPEGLRYTAARRGETWPADLNIEEAETTLRLRLLTEDRRLSSDHMSTEGDPHGDSRSDQSGGSRVDAALESAGARADAGSPPVPGDAPGVPDALDADRS